MPLDDDTELRIVIRKGLADFHAGTSPSFCIRTMVDELHETSSHLRGAVLAAILAELDDHRATNLKAAE
jgi:hypothetical protein